MDPIAISHQLARNAETIHRMVDGISDEQARWQPTPADWSMLEVINHLYDEEREDFRQRVDYVLHRPGENPPPIHPGEWVTSRHYNQRDVAESVQNFLAERQQSIAWLALLNSPNWDLSYHHPDGFRIRAGDLFTAWLAHDFLHLRQMVELHYAWTKLQAAPYEVGYAGDW